MLRSRIILNMALGKNFEAAPALAAPNHTLLDSKAKFLKRTTV
jgi:hypothetical protein